MGMTFSSIFLSHEDLTQKIITISFILLAIITFGCLTSMPFSFHIPPFYVFPSIYPTHQTLSPSLSSLHSSLNPSSKPICFGRFMAQSGFEGFEKRLELHFSTAEPTNYAAIDLGLRQIDFQSLEEVLRAVQCTVVSAMGNEYFDAYVLSESSLFVYPTKIIIKTCGTTLLLKAIPHLIFHAHNMGLNICGCMYSRGNFIFPKAQPFPHTSFKEEVMYLEENIPSNLCYRKACVMPSRKSSHSWHVYSACDQHNLVVEQIPSVFTVEVCMTGLDQVHARTFFLQPGQANPGDVAGREMSKLTGIGDINPRALLCDFAFDPCGYSMNGIDGVHYSTIHVTPEDGYSYASFECSGYSDDHQVIRKSLKKVLQIFQPKTMSVAITCPSGQICEDLTDSLQSLELNCHMSTVDEFPMIGNVIFQTFMTNTLETASKVDVF